MIMADNNENKVLNVPHLRFPEFTEEWEETTLGKISEITKGSGISKDQLSEQGSPCILYGELYTKYKSEIIDEVYSRTELDSSSLVKSKANDVIIPCSGETAIDISTARCVPFNNILLGGDLNIIRLKHDDGGFFAYQLNGARKKDIARVAQGVSVVHLYGENLKHIRVYHPAIEEQKKITRLLSLIDERIATQNKIIEDLKLLKSAISLNVLHSDTWEQFKIKDIAQIGRGRVISSIEISQQKNPTYPVYSSQTSNDGIMGYLDDYMFEGEYISWTTDGANAGTVFYRNGKFNCTNVCGLLKLIKGFDTHFVSLVLAEATKKYVSINLANPKLMNNTMGNIQICLPKLEEQKRISIVFRVLQRLWTVHNSLLTEYIKQKQYLLSQMFI
ncbi:restriction endonuclease subunit S [Bacteroides fragilis]|uniref:restriction endonuclease subunit S n=2 Tax=Bacteroidia TaxID=200643 RepID=UPI0032EF448D